MPYLPVAGGRLFYTESGPAAGQSMLLLHAALQDHESMAPLVKRLEPLGLRLVTLDLRGHGRSTNPGRSFAMDQLADDVAALMDHLGLERPLAAGYSLGGIVGIELARRGLLSGLVVLASRIRPANRARDTFAPDAIEARSPLWAKQLALKHTEVEWGELAQALGELLATWPGFTPAELSTIQSPLLVVQGDRDQMVPLQQGQELTVLVPGARLQVVPRAGHPDLLYRVDALAAVYEFVRGLLGE